MRKTETLKEMLWLYAPVQPTLHKQAAHAAQTSSPLVFPPSLWSQVLQGRELQLSTLVLFQTRFFLEKGKDRRKMC